MSQVLHLQKCFKKKKTERRLIKYKDEFETIPVNLGLLPHNIQGVE